MGGLDGDFSCVDCGTLYNFSFGGLDGWVRW